MVADKQHILTWQVTDMFGAGYFQPVEDRQCRVRDDSYEGIYDLSDQLDILKPFKKIHTVAFVPGWDTEFKANEGNNDPVKPGDFYPDGPDDPDGNIQDYLGDYGCFISWITFAT